jgi:hypothetical protein
VTNDVMARGYVARAVARAEALKFFLAAQAWPDVVREAQESVELFLKAALRAVAGHSTSGHVWVQLSLTRSRLGEPFVPMVVVVANLEPREAVLTRDSFRLTGADGRSVSVAGLKEVRSGYHKSALDRRMLSLTGLPTGTILVEGRVIASNFFPPLSGGSAPTVIDRVALPPYHAMVDLLYFARPEGLAVGQPVILEVAPEGWERPIPVRIQIAPQG